MLERLKAWGVGRVYGYPGDGTNGLNLAFHEVGDEARVRPGAPRGARGVRGLRARQAHRRGRRLHGDLRPGRHPPAQRALRRQARQRARRRHRRPAEARCRSAATSSRRSTCARSSRTSPPSTWPRSTTRARPPHVVDRAVRIALAQPHRDRDHRPLRRPGAAPRGAAARPRRRSTPGRPAITPRSCVRATRTCAAPPSVLNAGEQGGDARRARAPRARPTRSSRSPTCSAPASPRRSTAAPRCPTTCPSSPARSACSGTKPSDDMMQGCDTLLMVGTSFPYSEWLPEPGQARGVQIDIDARKLGIRYPVEVAMVGDAAETLRALIPACSARRTAPGARRSRPASSAGGACWTSAPTSTPTRSTPSSSSTSSPSGCPIGAIVLADSGSATNWFARHLRLRRGMDTALSGTLATMCPAVPYALAAKLAFPQRPVIALPRRRRDADARHQRPHRPRALPGPLERPARRARAQQRRPQPGHLGAARAGRRRRSCRRRRTCRPSTSPPTRASSASRASGSRRPARSGRPGSARWPRSGPPSSTS